MSTGIGTGHRHPHHGVTHRRTAHSSHRAPLRSLHRAHNGHPFDRSVPPPARSGMRWSTCAARRLQHRRHVRRHPSTGPQRMTRRSVAENSVRTVAPGTRRRAARLRVRRHPNRTRRPASQIPHTTATMPPVLVRNSDSCGVMRDSVRSLPGAPPQSDHRGGAPASAPLAQPRRG